MNQVDNEQQIEKDDIGLSDQEIKDIFLTTPPPQIFKSTPIIDKKHPKKRIFRDLTPKELEELEKKEKLSQDRANAGRKSIEKQGIFRQAGEDLKIAPINPVSVVEKVKSQKKRVEEELEKKKKAFRNLQTIKLYENNCIHIDKAKYMSSDTSIITSCEKCSREKRWDPRVWQEYHRKMKSQL